jgi:galactonate dehydratase
VAIPIAGGEHHETWELFRNAMKRDVYDIIQPDACLSNLGIGGLRRLAALAEKYGKGFSPHVLFWGNHPLYLAATLHVLGAIRHNGWLEYIHDPPTVTPENQQPIARQPLLVEPDGCVRIPTLPGLGVELDEDFIDEMSRV